ncbi:pre-peptidase C-terminal domain-containing protein [Oscillatoria sp. FACHB-1407]|uniref:clostripain-related cysteine peptidase n=1 Tax=Oscillatoria sp. FACHB-1407 TaxID=2692847 RepID=UPI0016825E38|nr:clostripain-related cysteine peptidase [Oscillatoria sp. FACHB-1407]MBD2464386.1 pre-peptidase C-terminal domain-containing protein [Oscillatoria sp. FACHB-1407]
MLASTSKHSNALKSASFKPSTFTSYSSPLQSDLSQHNSDSVSKARSPFRRASSSRDLGNTRGGALNLGSLKNRILTDGVGGAGDRSDFARFTVTGRQNLRLSLRGMTANADVQLFNQAGVAIAGSYQKGAAADRINCDLEAGTYYVRVFSTSGRTNYNLSLSTRRLSNVSTMADNPAPTGNRADWTVMVYMSSDDLESYTIEDFREMASIGSTSNVNIVLQYDRTAADHPKFIKGQATDDTRYGNWTDTRRGLVSYGSTPGRHWGTSIGEANMGDANTLRNFLDWSMSNYQADNYALIVWGHGSGTEVAFDDITNDALSANEFNSVLGGLSDTIDLVGMDACLMGTVEFAHAIRDNASVFVGSQENIPGTSWDYATTLQDLVANPAMTASQFGSSIVNRYAQTYPLNIEYPVDEKDLETLSAIDLTAMRDSNPFNLSSALSDFANAVMYTATDSDLQALGSTRNTYSNQYGEGSFPDYVDIGHLFSNVVNNSWISTDIRAAAQDVLTAYTNTIISNFTATADRSTGLSIYFSARGKYPSSNHLEVTSNFVNDTLWDNFLAWEDW